MNDALAECIFHFRDFWGQRLVNVLRAIHMLLVSGENMDDDNNKGPKPGTGNPKWIDKFFGTDEDV